MGCPKTHAKMGIFIAKSLAKPVAQVFEQRTLMPAFVVYPHRKIGYQRSLTSTEWRKGWRGIVGIKLWKLTLLSLKQVYTRGKSAGKCVNLVIGSHFDTKALSLSLSRPDCTQLSFSIKYTQRHKSLMSTNTSLTFSTSKYLLSNFSRVLSWIYIVSKKLSKNAITNNNFA